MGGGLPSFTPPPYERIGLLLRTRELESKASNEKGETKEKWEREKKETLNTPQRLTVVINVPKSPLLMAGWLEAGRVV